jgi:hypothetical protein
MYQLWLTILKDFLKFLSLVAILYCGFLSTFCLLGRGQFTTRQMALILTKVFFGSAYLGFDISDKISPYLGLPLMLVFITLVMSNSMFLRYPILILNALATD